MAQVNFDKMNASTTGATPRTRPSASAMSGLRLNVQEVHNRLQEENESREADRGLNLDFSRPRDGQQSRRPRPCMYCSFCQIFTLFLLDTH